MTSRTNQLPPRQRPSSAQARHMPQPRLQSGAGRRLSPCSARTGAHVTHVDHAVGALVRATMRRAVVEYKPMTAAASASTIPKSAAASPSVLGCDRVGHDQVDKRLKRQRYIAQRRIVRLHDEFQEALQKSLADVQASAEGIFAHQSPRRPPILRPPGPPR